MHAILRHLGACAALGVTLAMLTGTALAAPPETPPGLETAPGQEQKAEQAAAAAAEAPAATAPAPVSVPAPASPPGQAKKAAAAASSSSPPGSHGIRSTNAGVKPSNDTKKHTSCTTGGSMPSPTCTGSNVSSATPDRAAGNDHSKRYGNGSTAAQIAVSRGGVGVEVRGPGNSQPHKVCGKNGNWVDVHAVKTYAGLTACASAPAASSNQPNVASVQTVFASPFVAGAGAASAGLPGAGAAGAAAAPAAGGVAGVTATRPEAGGVAGALAEIGGVAGGALPFTGFPLWAAILLAVAAIAVGVGLRWSGRALTTPV